MARIHEYKGKEILKKFKFNTPPDNVAHSVDEAKANCKSLIKSLERRQHHALE